MGNGAIGSINTMLEMNADNYKGSSQQANSGFGSVLASITDLNTIATTIDNKKLDCQLPKEEIEDLISFLQNQDIFSFENGAELLDKILSNSELLPGSLAIDNLGISGEDIAKIFEKIQHRLNTVDENQKVDSTKLFENMDDIVAILSNLQQLPNQEFQKLVDQDFVKLMKFTKMVELLSKNQDLTAQNPELTRLIESVTTKLEQFVKSNTYSFRTEFIQKTFTLLTRELNQKTTENASAFRTQMVGKDGIIFPSKIFTMLNIEQKIPTNIYGKQMEGLESGLTSIPQMMKPEQLTIMLENSKSPVSTEKFIQQFESILAKSQFGKMNGMQKLLIKLAPEHLGSLRIELIQKDQMLVAKILTTTGAAKDTLDSQLNGLKQAMASQNIHVEKIEITQQMNPQERSLQRDPEHHESGNEEGNNKQEQQDSLEEFTESFAEALVNLEV